MPSVLPRPSAGSPTALPPARRSSPDRRVQDGWVRRLKARDPEAMREVVEAYSERLGAVVAGILRDRDAVEDVVQDTFVKAWFRIDAFRGGSGLYTWLYRIAVNASKDHAKRRGRRPASSLEALGPEAHPATPPAQLEDLDRREERLRVREAIAALPGRFRIVLALRELEGMSYEEIARVVGASLGTVESRIFRARRRLRALLAPPQDPTGDPA